MQSLSEFFGFVYDWIFVIRLITVSLSLVIVYDPLDRTWKGYLMAFLKFLTLFAAGSLLNLLFFSLARPVALLRAINFPLSWLAVIAAYLGVFTHRRHMGNWIMGATLFVTVIAMADLGGILMSLADEAFPARSWTWLYLLADLLILTFAYMMRRLSLLEYREVPKVSIVCTVANALISTAVIIIREKMTLFSGSNVSYQFFDAAVYIAIYIISAFTYLMVYFQCREHQEKMTLLLQNKLLESDAQMLRLSKQAVNSLKELRHDIKNQYKVMEIMLEEQRYDELKDYFASMNDWFRSNSGMHYIDCGNKLVNSVLNMEYMKASSEHVELTTKLNCPAFIPFDASDLTRVLVNLIDNAVEATVRAEGEKSSVDCRIGLRGDYLYIGVINPLPKDADPEEILKMKTDKKDSENHGYGHRIVARIVEKYNGFVNYSIEENEFLAEVMMDLTSGKAVKAG